MDADKLRSYASLAEIVSAGAIVVSLLYVGYEYSRASIVSSREADVILFERTREANRILIESPGMAEIIVAADRIPEEMSDAERMRYLAYKHDFFDTWEVGWSYHADGILEPSTWQEWDEWFVAEARRSPQWAWAENRHHFTGQGFRQHVDLALSGG